MHGPITKLMLPTMQLQELRAFHYHEYLHVILKVVSVLWLTLKMRVTNNNNPPSLVFISQPEHLIQHEVFNFLLQD